MIPISSSKGFTLLEILVSFVILAVVGSALLQLFHSGLTNLSTSQEYTRAALLARSKLSELDAISYSPQNNNINLVDDKYRIQIEMQPYDDGALPPNPSLTPLLVQLTVQWGPESHPNQFRLASILLLPEESPTP